MYVLQIKSAKCKVQKVQNAATHIKQLSGQMYLVGRSDFRGWRSVEGVQEKNRRRNPFGGTTLTDQTHCNNNFRYPICFI